MKMKVLVIDPGKKPEFVEVDLTDKYMADFDESDEYEQQMKNCLSSPYDSYKIARDLLNQWEGAKGDTFIQRVQDNYNPHLGIYVDEDGRCKGLQANRYLVYQDGYRVKIAGRVVLVPDSLEGGYFVARTNEEYNNRLFERFMHFNCTDGEDDLTKLTQEESDNLSGECIVLDGKDAIEYFKRKYGI